VTIGRARVRQADVVIGTSPQFRCAVAGYALSRTLGAGFVFEVRDVWPEGVLAVNYMKANAFYRGAVAVAHHMYEHADRIVTPGEGYKNTIHRLHGTPLAKFGVIPNGIDTGLLLAAGGCAPRGTAGGPLSVMYVGTLGNAPGSTRCSRGGGPARGSSIRSSSSAGARKVNLKRQAAGRAGNRVHRLSAERASRASAAARPGPRGLRSPLHSEVLPSKIFSTSAWSAILLCLDGEARHIVESAGAGVRLADPGAVAAPCGLAGDRRGSRWGARGGSTCWNVTTGRRLPRVRLAPEEIVRARRT
jgi:hypothetical protein